MFDVVEIDRAERRLRLLQRRSGLDFDELVLEIIAARKGRDDLVALLWRLRQSSW